MEKATKPKISFRPDEQGNKFELKKNGKFTTVYLWLASENKKRLLGTINPENKTLYIKRSRDKHLFNKTKSYGFNHYLLANATLFDDIYLTEDNYQIKIPKKYILDNGEFLMFKQQGFERQIFLPLAELIKFALFVKE